MAEAALLPPKTLDPTKPQAVTYCIPLWLRDEQILRAIARVPHRIQPHYDPRPDPIAVVCYGPSLNETWEELKAFKYFITCSGSHRFLIERGIVPTWHVEVDPRPHKATLIGTPHPDVEYLIASTCHRDVFDLLEGYTVKLWHIFDNEEEGLRILPRGEWALTGGCSAGLRAMAMARFLGFSNLHIFGMDGSAGTSGQHAGAHPNQAKKFIETPYDGVTYLTSPAFLEAARGTFHELDQMSDVQVEFHGEGLVQHMARNWTPKRVGPLNQLAFIKDELITSAYRDLNVSLHVNNLAYGVGGGKHAKVVQQIAEKLKTQSILDYGCGKGYLAKALPFPIWEYDPAIPGKDQTPRAADFVVCTDVLEHIEPEKLLLVLDDLCSCMKKVGYFVIDTGPAQKTLPDGRNTHLIQEARGWWEARLEGFFKILRTWESKHQVQFLVAPKLVKDKPALRVLANDDIRFSFGRLMFRRDPYVIGSTVGVLEDRHYEELARTFPTDLSRYKAFTGGDQKWSLSERYTPDAYAEFIASEPIWAKFYAYIKGEPFKDKMRRVLGAHKIPIPADFYTRFEFSILPAEGGLLRPHTDIPSKMITLIIPMLQREERWDLAWGGGTDVLRPKDPSMLLEDYKAPLEAFETVTTFPYVSNQCVVFVKTTNSWHSVGPIKGPAGLLRKTVTINLERMDG